jgi:hypothetical protein
MLWIIENKRLWRAALLGLLLIAIMGPWVFDIIHVPIKLSTFFLGCVGCLAVRRSSCHNADPRGGISGGKKKSVATIGLRPRISPSFSSIQHYPATADGRSQHQTCTNQYHILDDVLSLQCRGVWNLGKNLVGKQEHRGQRAQHL